MLRIVFTFIQFLLLTALLLFPLSSCSWIMGSNDEVEAVEMESDFRSEIDAPLDHETSKVAIEKLPDKKDTTEEEQVLDKVEVLWKIPENPVDGFILHYGYAKEALTRTLRLSLSDIEKYEDPQFGYVYRYVITQLLPEKPVYISLQTIEGEKISEPSEIFEVTPE